MVVCSFGRVGRPENRNRWQALPPNGRFLGAPFFAPEQDWEEQLAERFEEWPDERGAARCHRTRVELGKWRCAARCEEANLRLALSSDDASLALRPDFGAGQAPTTGIATSVPRFRLYKKPQKLTKNSSHRSDHGLY
jgi:hypothetical protein